MQHKQDGADSHCEHTCVIPQDTFYDWKVCFFPQPMKGNVGLNRNRSEAIQIHDTLSALPFIELFILKGGGEKIAYHFSVPAQPIYLLEIRHRIPGEGKILSFPFTQNILVHLLKRKQLHLEADGKKTGATGV